MLLNNGQLGKISKEQRAGEWDVWQTSLHNPDFSGTPSSAARSASASPTPRQLDAASRARSRTTARRWSRS